MLKKIEKVDFVQYTNSFIPLEIPLIHPFHPLQVKKQKMH